MKNPRVDDPSFVKNFKAWMSENATNRFNLQPPNREPIVEVESRVGLSALRDKMQPEEGDAEELAKEFHLNGGKILEADGTLLMIEVANGSFIISRSCCRRKD